MKRPSRVTGRSRPRSVVDESGTYEFGWRLRRMTAVIPHTDTGQSALKWKCWSQPVSGW